MSEQFSEFLNQVGLAPVREHTHQMTLPPGQTVFHQGDDCANYLLVISGSVKVFSRAENGREVILYRVTDGESCTLTTACLFAQNHYPAEGVTETETRALAIPRDVFNRGLAESEAFRKMVFDQYAKRLADVIGLVEQLSFGRIDIRLARLLLRMTHDNSAITITHQEIATELGSAREVVSRQLKAFEHLQLLELKRGSIDITNSQGLQKIAEARLI